jgi:hypothetical protein
MDHLILTCLAVIVGLSLGLLVFIPVWKSTGRETVDPEPILAQTAGTSRR